jgi:hypothetical protein
MSTAQISQTINKSKVDVATTLVVFDSRVPDLDLLYSALLPGSIGFTAKAEADGLATITQLLATTGAKYLAIVAHGAPGVVHLGNNSIDLGQIRSQSHRLQSWGVEEIVLYSCEVAQGSIGKDFIYQLSELTGATVAASATKIGSAALGGNWGSIVTTAPIVFESSILEYYQSVLPVSASTATNFAVGNVPRSIAVADLNNDGKLDLATANYSSNNISVLLGNGTGGFTVSNFPVGSDAFAITVGDFNSDNILDLATANNSGNNVSVLLGNVAGGFGTATNFALGPDTNPYDLTVGYFNNDNILDLVTVNNRSNNVSVLLGNGTGGFGAPTFFAVGINPRSVTVGDFNNDSKLDLATANYGSNDISVLSGDGLGSFGIAANLALGTSNPTSVTAGDFNGDGRLDLATANIASNVSVILGAATASGFGAITNFAVGNNPVPNSPFSVKAGDFNGDGQLDLATANSDSENVSVLLGNGAGGFGAPTVFKVGNGPASVAAGDFNRDGRLDLAAANSGSETVSVLLNTTTIRSDFNRDNKSDILWRNTNGDVALWQMNGSTLVTGSVFANVSTAWTIANTGDFNSDGKADILWRNTDGQVEIWQMNGNTPISKTVIGSADTDWKISSTGDFNADSKSDILWRNDSSGQVAIWQMDGTTPTKTVIGSADTDWKIAGTGDFNGDGKADILWRNDDGRIALWQMNGSALLSPTSLTSTPRADTDWKINGIADFNGDGKSDILWRNDSSGQVAVWTMNGATVLSRNLTSPNSIVDSNWKITGTGDFSSDGKADILWRNDNGSTAIWQMDGSMVTSTSLISTSLTSTPLVVDSSWKIAAPIL